MAAPPITQEPRASALGWGGGTEQQQHLRRYGMVFAQQETEAPETLVFIVVLWEAGYPIGWSVGDGMIITHVTVGRPAWASGLRPGMRILEVQDQTVDSVAAVESTVAGRTEIKVEAHLGRWAAPQGGGWRPVTSNYLEVTLWWDPSTGRTAYKGPGRGPREGARDQSSPAPSGRTAHSPCPSPSPDSPDRSLSPPPASPRSGSSCKRAGPEGSPTGRNGAASPGGRCTSPLLSPAAPQRNPGSRLVAITRYLRACAACCPCDTDSAQSQ
eukprot:TRINITY_DN1555_c0_g1_i7.p1 TRINITY_DN1555_c0_g1~~TRINITY_DN1555_c0_g1_i7.p1  ORF type:complete len:270 (+),score=35.83 TRINITY_DN1555_c0_g1_i7:85-894(+)